MFTINIVKRNRWILTPAGFYRMPLRKYKVHAKESGRGMYIVDTDPRQVAHVG